VDLSAIEGEIVFMEAFKKLRIPVACALTAAFVLIGLFHAPIVPVIAGCAFSLLYLFLKSWSRLSAGKEGH
jgi:hypothetical protein